MTNKSVREKVNYHQDKGQCQVCKKIDHTSIWKVFKQVSWFRGDDEYVGKVCKRCRGQFIKSLKE